MQLTPLLPSALLASVFLLGCSDPAPPTAQGGLQFNTSAASPAVSGRKCTTPGYVIGIGNPPPNLSGDQPGKRTVDGEKSTTIKCKVSGGNEITFSGTVGGPNVLDTQTAYGVNFRINGKLNADGTGNANVSFDTPLVGGLANDQQCTLKGVTIDGKPQWGDGLVWTQFTCPTMVDPSVPATLCSTAGAIVLENCED